MTGPLAQQFAQVRGALRRLHFGHGYGRLPEEGRCEYCDCREDATVALSSIERHVQDMEKALRDLGEPIMDERFRDRLLRHVLSNEEVASLVDAIYQQQSRALNALAALPAREKEEE